MKWYKVLTKSVMVLVCLASSLNLNAQQDPLYTNYMFNKMVYNPAYAGVNPSFIYVNMLAHNQWTGFTGSVEEYTGLAPTTQTFDINYPFANSRYLGGAGMYIIRDLSGYESNTTTNFTLSAKKYFNFGAVFLGVNGGFIQRQINNTKWIYPDGSSGLYDPLIPIGFYQDVLPDLGAGIYIVNRNFYVGFSSQHLIGGDFNWGGSKNTLVRHSYFLAGYNFEWPSNPKFEIQPSILFKTDETKTQFDFNTNIMYNSRYWAGLQYRQGDAVSALFGVMLAPCLRFGYAYDLTLTNMNDYSNGTHEIVITYCFRKKIGDVFNQRVIWTPRFL